MFVEFRGKNYGFNRFHCDFTQNLKFCQKGGKLAVREVSRLPPASLTFVSLPWNACMSMDMTMAIETYLFVHVRRMPCPILLCSTPSIVFDYVIDRYPLCFPLTYSSHIMYSLRVL